MIELSAVLAELIYTNPENGYTVAVFEEPEEDVSFTAVGVLPFAREGRRYRLEGDWGTHKRYGEQFSFSSAKEELPTTVDGIESFLASGLIRGVGRKTAKAIVSRFKEETLKIIETEPRSPGSVRRPPRRSRRDTPPSVSLRTSRCGSRPTASRSATRRSVTTSGERTPRTSFKRIPTSSSTRSSASALRRPTRSRRSSALTARARTGSCTARSTS